MPPLDRPLHILLVENDEVDIQSVERVLKEINLMTRLHIAKDGIEAWDMLYNQSDLSKIIPTPELIILDINMPKMNGIELLRQIRKNPEFDATNVIIFTTSNDQKDKVSALSLNIAGYMSKPLQVDEFLPLCRLLLSK